MEHKENDLVKKRFVFLILHYNTIEETKKCVQSIFERVKVNYDIVIVDNGSTNNTGEELKECYKDKSQIKIIINEKGYGFSKGNNIGFKYIKENLNPDYIIMINSDIEIILDNFCEIIDKEFQVSKFAVLGPRILLPRNRIDDFKFEMITLKEAKKELTKKKIAYFADKIYLYYLLKFFMVLPRAIKKIFFDLGLMEEKVDDKSKRREMVALQGSCLIFSKEYIEKFDGIDEKTDFYCEEYFLFLKLMDNNLLSVYNPYLIVYHNENATTNKTYSSKKKKRKFTLSNIIKSDKELVNELKMREVNKII
ncbi:MAG: glycosyltransferase family 2 protein [Clostridia bacterium]|nr:glycosyltransferase family 2 protein [Clostridia bacterium]